MENKINTYTGNINEFVDWVTGQDSNTEQNVTNNLPVSGGSIRKLIQDRLKVPFCMYEDKENNLYRMFSSKASLDLWFTDRIAYSKLELFNFVRPSEYEISTDINLNPRYLMSGDDSQTASVLSYNWVVKNSTGEFLDTITATYTITDKDGNMLSFSEIYSTTHKSVTLNLYKYLKAGNNTISVILKGNSTGAILGVTFIMVLLTLLVDSTFDFNAKHSLGEKLDIPYTITRNNTSIATTIYFYIDGVKVLKVDIAANSASTFIKNTISVVNSYVDKVKHNLLIWAEMEYDNSTFKSNIMYFTFETASDSTITNYFINVKLSFLTGIPPLSLFTMTGTQYLPVNLQWGYYTDNLLTDTSISVVWSLKQGDTVKNLNSITVDRYEQASDLVFSPIIYTTDDQPITLVGTYGTKELINIPITIAKSDLVMYETPNYSLKLSAYGKTNTSVDKTVWKDDVNNIDTTFTNISYDDNIGWNGNALRLNGLDAYATINYVPLNGNPSLGRTIEFEFESEKVNSDNDVIILIGSTQGGRIEVTPNTATIYDASGISILHTNFKSNERVKLAFIINETNSTVDSNLIYIVNNGILERAGGGAGYVFTNNTGKITIGKSLSGVKFYGIRVYNRAISYTDAYNNYVFDSDNKGNIIASNNVVSNGSLSYDLCVNKIDTVLISGDLSKILNSSYDKDQSVSDVTIERFCPFDATKNFKIENGLIRKHGQSTLNYPITSMKFWSNKSVNGATPIFTCTSLIPLLLTKNRYKMKDTSIPSNKWVLQTNYADSSGVHNGSLERLFNDTWYNAKIDGEYKLRTEPLLFATNEIVTYNDSNLHEDGYIAGRNSAGKQWKDYFTTDFPYQLRTTPDSFPCVVFYQDTSGSNVKTFLGQYVFMEDKGSDYCYGERSIYKASSKDVFVLTSTYKGLDTDANNIWDNTNVSRFEVLDVNSIYTSYMGNTGFTSIITDSITGQPVQYGFELKFEMIYPDPGDLNGNPTNGTDKFGANSKFLRKATPFINWFNWLVGTYKNQTKFEAEAAQHLDLWKMAAYYIPMLRYGLVDSCERNAQIKTYDGVHFHYETWDMDIALGNQNTGGIAFNPPIDRNSTLSTDNSVYAFSGKSPTTSNWLFDALEAWPYWRDVVVPKVALALYQAGLSYDNSMLLFDGEYALKWCEIIYNESGHFKYVQSRAGANSWLNWLQGARTTHRHWWLSTSMDYYDAKWSCGDFKNHYIYFALNHDAGTVDGVDIITVKPNASTYIKLSKNYDEEAIATIYTTKANPALFDISKVSLSTKTPLTFYGATFIEDLDMSCVASKIDTVNLAGAYSNVLGASIKTLNIGIPIIKGANDYTYTGTVSGMTVKMSAVTVDGYDALSVLHTLNIRGLQGITSSTELISDYNRTSVVDVYAMGSGLGNFYSAPSGNRFGTLELPCSTSNATGLVSTLGVIRLQDSSWNDMTFWETLIGTNNLSTFTKCNINGDYTLNVPSSLKSVSLLGTTGGYENSKNFVLEWIKCIEAENQSIGEKTLIMDRINWSPTTCSTLLTYSDLSKLAQFNAGKNTAVDNTLKGYIVLDTGGVKLTAEQLTLIKAWFGDTVFNKNSAGLVIDHKMDYIQINVGSNAYISNEQVYLAEGQHASLNATKFALGDADSGTYNWFLKEPGSVETGLIYKKTYLEIGDDGIMYIYADESSYGNYDVEVLCTSTESSLNTSITIHIVSVTYPTTFNLTQDGTVVRIFGTSYVFWKPSIMTEFYLSPSSTYTGTVKDVTFNVTTLDGTELLPETTYTLFKGSSTQPITLDNFLGYAKNAVKQYGISVCSIDTEDTMHQYILNSKITFVSGKVMTTNVSIMLMTDKIAIVSNDASVLFKVINAKYLAQYSLDKSSFYRTDLIALTGSLNFTTDPTWLAITSLKTQNARSIFKYLPNITEVILDGCTALPSTNVNITYVGDTTDQLVFDLMPNLVKLSILNCTTLNKDISLTNNVNMSVLDMSGTTINAILPTGINLTTYELGTPTTIAIDSPIRLTPDGVKVDTSTSIDSIDLLNIPNNKTFTAFAKIMNL